MDGRIFQLKNRILENIRHDWTIEEFAQNVNISPRHLQKIFKNQMGVPPIAYLRELRLEKAREFLEDSFYQIKEIGSKVGMPNDSHFTRDFKKKFGVTPTEYRKQFWDKIQAGGQDGRK